jgi:hypothetical protein
MIRAGDLCCYSVYQVPTLCQGRPYIVAGEARQARKANRKDWGKDARRATSLAVVDPVAVLPAVTRARLSDAWLADALAEHASIASFARFTLDLLAVGAPPDLIVESQRASIDEVDHARLCFSLADRYGERPVGPDAMPIGDASRSLSLAELAVAVVCEGCLGETVASLVAAEQHRVATDATVRAAMTRIAEDEARHAELAWRTVRWAIERGGEPVRRAVRRAFDAALAASGFGSGSRGPDADDSQLEAAWNAHGRLTAAQQRDVTEAAIRDVIVPCMRALTG